MGDYGYVTIIPQVGKLRTTPEARKLPCIHASETARPDYYRVSLDAGADGTIEAERTATATSRLSRSRRPIKRTDKVSKSSTHGAAIRQATQWQISCWATR